MDQPGKVANPARGQLNRENEYVPIRVWTRSTVVGGRGCNKFVPVLGENGTKIAPTGDVSDQPPGPMR